MVVRENLGVTFGLVVRSMGFARNFTAGFKSLRQGEVSEYTDLLEDARRHAVDRLVANAKLLGANGIIAMRFDSSEMGNQLTEVVAYGTAVVVERAGAERADRGAARPPLRRRPARRRRARATVSTSLGGARRDALAGLPPLDGARRAQALGPPARRVRRRRPSWVPTKERFVDPSSSA